MHQDWGVRVPGRLSAEVPSVIDVPTSTELLVVAAAAYVASMAVSLGWWVARDARARDSASPLLWSLASVLTPVGLPLYLFVRLRDVGFGGKPSATRLDRLLATWASASLAAFLSGAFFAPPDPFSLVRYVFVSLALFLPFTYLLFARGGYRRLRESAAE